MYNYVIYVSLLCTFFLNKRKFVFGEWEGKTTNVQLQLCPLMLPVNNRLQSQLCHHGYKKGSCSISRRKVSGCSCSVELRPSDRRTVRIKMWRLMRRETAKRLKETSKMFRGLMASCEGRASTEHQHPLFFLEMIHPFLTDAVVPTLPVVFFFLQKLTRGAISHRLIHHICTSASKFSIKSSPFLCSMSHSLIHHSRQGDWAAARVVNDHSESGSKHEETPTGTKRICAKCSPFLIVNYFVWLIF